MWDIFFRIEKNNFSCVSNCKTIILNWISAALSLFHFHLWHEILHLTKLAHMMKK
jgi:hypothetical protein